MSGFLRKMGNLKGFFFFRNGKLENKGFVHFKKRNSFKRI